MDELELVGLLHRADWTRLSLTGAVSGAAASVLSVFGGQEYWSLRSEAPVPRPPDWTPDQLEGDIALDLAPGKRFHLTSADGRWAGGCDGSRVWQRLPDPLPADTVFRFRSRPQPPVAPLLAPSWLLSGHTLTAGEPTVVCGRPGVQFTAVPEEGDLRRHRQVMGELLAPMRWNLAGKYERVVAVVDGALGILLCCELQFADRDADVTEFARLALDAEADPSVFSAPPGSLFGDGPAVGDFGAGTAAKFALEAGKTIGGLAAGGLGAVVRLTPGRRADPFERATAEAADPDMVMPVEEELPGWAAGNTGDGTAAAGEQGRIPVSDEVLHLLYRGGAEMAPFTATLHDWINAGATIASVPQAARRAGFGGVGFLVDSVLRTGDRSNPVMHTAHLARFGGWDRYRLDLLSGTADGRPGRPAGNRYQEVTIACDGSRCWRVYTDRVKVSEATPWYNLAGELADGSWLLGCQLGDGGEAEVDGRPGYRVIATANPGSVPPNPFATLAGGWLPAVAVVDATTGRLLRLTRYTGGRVGRRLEFRSLSDGGPDDFGFTPPDGLRVEERAAGRRFAEHVDERVGAARGFLESLRGDGQRGRD